MPTIDDYKIKAAAIFSDLVEYTTNGGPFFFKEDNYWKNGNVFDTLVDFILVASQQKISVNSITISSVISQVADQYIIDQDAGDSYNNHGSQDSSPQGRDYDDFGWWGIASAKAFTSEYEPVFGKFGTQTNNKFQDIAKSCWHIMTNGCSKPTGQTIVNNFGAPKVWAKCDKSLFSSVKPRFDGGIWQTDINTQISPIDIPSKEIYKTNLGPFQLSVVNGLYFVLGLRLAAAGHDVGAAMDDLYEFFMNWCFDPSVTSQDQQLLLTLSPSAGLIRERVSTYKNGDPVYGYSPSVAWCGDQGLMMGGLVDYSNARPGALQAQNLVTTILNGVGQYMATTLMDHTVAIAPWYPTSYSSDPSDYGSGPGVFMRYLLYGYKYNPQIKAQVNIENSQIRNLLFSSANACVNGTFPDFVAGQDSDKLFNSFNQLSILTTAIHVLADQGKTQP